MGGSGCRRCERIQSNSACPGNDFIAVLRGVVSESIFTECIDILIPVVQMKQNFLSPKKKFRIPLYYNLK